MLWVTADIVGKFILFKSFKQKFDNIIFLFKNNKFVGTLKIYKHGLTIKSKKSSKILILT